jgi:hypothetical protein
MKTPYSTENSEEPVLVGSARCAERTPQKLNNRSTARFAACGVPTLEQIKTAMAQDNQRTGNSG